ncbi:MAG: signal peptidase I [Candidatus Colwellbacteria bacterium]|nr:signal peptidase I [Candidatus Colwellbacteria bacterium]
MQEEQEIKTPIHTNKVGHDLLEIVRVLLVSLAIVLPIRYFIIQPFIVRGASMEPNFYDKEYLIVDEISYYFGEPTRGDTIVFRYPLNTSQYFIKRIIALPGETIKISDGKVHIFNGQNPEGFLLDEPYLENAIHSTHPASEVMLGKDEFFVLGDNRDFSSDSRVWGSLKREFIVGRVLFRAWPLERFGVLITHNS